MNKLAFIYQGEKKSVWKTLFTRQNLAIGISLIAVLFSGLSYLSSQSSAKIARAAYDSQFKVVWVSEVEGDALLLKSLGGEQLPQQIIVSTPTEFGGDQYELELNRRVYPLTRLKADLIQKLEDKYPVEDGYAQIVSLKVPLGVRTLYSTGGENFEDHSIYFLNFVATITPSNAENSSVRFTGFSFVGRQVPKTKTYPILDLHWETVQKNDWMTADNSRLENISK